MKTIMISAPASGSGKTTISLGLIRALRRKGLDICAYKTGPDYIDRMFLEEASGYPAGNLDIHLQTEPGMNYALSQAPSEYSIIEGVMGFFDGISNTYQNSGYDICNRLGIGSVLVYTPKGEMFSAIPKIQGMANFPSSPIKAVLFNNISETYYTKLKTAVEEYTDLPVLGYLPKLKNVVFESRHLGLVQSNEVFDLNSKLDEIAAVLKDHVNLDQLVELMSEPAQNPIGKFDLKKRDITVAIARDKAFSFLYRENVELFEKFCHVTYFSPLEDPHLPECDLLYLGGGYPEVFRQDLAANRDLMDSIRSFGENQGYILAECGGLMYLTEAVDGDKMVGLLKGECQLTKSLQRFGYIDIVLSADCFLGKKGTKLTAHEFHKSVANVTYPTVFDIQKTMGDNTWTCGFQYKNTIAGYPHFNFLGNLKSFTHMLDTIQNQA